MKMKRIIALASTFLIGATTASVFTGCGATDSDYDPTKANLTVATYDGGVGYAWLQDAAQRFMDLHVNSTHFQEGRTGVKISVDADKVKYGGVKLADSNMTKDMYFTEGVEYFTFVNRGKVAPLTDIISGEKSDMSAYGESGTIEDKLDPSFQQYLTTTTDKEYYMLPFYSGFYGFIYDIQLFEEQGFYFDQDGEFLRLKIRGDEETEKERADFEAAKSNGPDGKKGTYDDGLPATYAQFTEMVKQIKTKGYVPFCYSGGYSDYVDKSFRSLAIDHEGYDNFVLNYSFDGETTLVKEVKADGTVVMDDKPTTITPENGYELQRQAGKYYALKLQEDLFSSVEYVGGTWNGFDYTVAQSEFINSKYASNGKRYAMLLEGVWWENEAEDTFTEIETVRQEGRADRRFGFMSMPKATEDKVGEKQTLFSGNSSFGFINAKCENMDLALEFMKFLHTDAEMAKFTAKTSIPRSLKYTIDGEIRKTATPYGKSVIDMLADADVVYPYSALPIVINNYSAFTEGVWFFNSTIGGTVNSPFAVFTADNNKATAKDYFDGLYTYQKNAWDALQK